MILYIIINNFSFLGALLQARWYHPRHQLSYTRMILKDHN